MAATRHSFQDSSCFLAKRIAGVGAIHAFTPRSTSHSPIGPQTQEGRTRNLCTMRMTGGRHFRLHRSPSFRPPGSVSSGTAWHSAFGSSPCQRRTMRVNCPLDMSGKISPIPKRFQSMGVITLRQSGLRHRQSKPLQTFSPAMERSVIA